MGIFRQFPYTNFHEMNLDWILSKVKELWAGVEALDEKVDNFIADTEPIIRDEVSSWLDEHPEATTTVQDNSLTTAKYMDGSVTNEKIHDHTLTEIKFSPELVEKYYNVPFRRSLDNMTVIQQDTAYFIEDFSHHIAFPSVCDAGDGTHIYVAFRRGSEHASYDGTIRIMYGTQNNLAPYASISLNDEDCRDPKLLMHNGTLYCLFTTRLSNGTHKSYASKFITDQNIDTQLINAYFIGGQPIVDNGIFYVPCYTGGNAYIAMGSSLYALDIVPVAEGYNEFGICKAGDYFLMVFRNANDQGNARFIKTRTIEGQYLIDEELPINAHAPCLFNLDNKYILLGCTSKNVNYNVNNYTGETDIYTMNMNGDLINPVVNLFAGNNGDVGYPSMCLINNSRLVIAFYLNFRNAIVVMSLSGNRWTYHQTHGDVMYRDIPRQQLNFTDGQKYDIYNPLGCHRIAGLRTSIPTDTASVLTGNHIYIRTFYERRNVVVLTGNGSDLNVDARMICIQNKFNDPQAYTNASNTDGTFIPVT